MSTTTTSVKQLKMNIMTQQQYDTATKNPNELYMVTDAELPSGKNIGEIVTSTIPLTDAGLHLLDGSLLQGSGIYGDFVDYMANLYGDGTDIPSYFCTESEWQTAATTYGSCPKFVYDSANNTLRLPKRTSEHGELILSNISGTTWYRVYEDGWCEQGGNSQTGTPVAATTVIFPKPFIDTNYIIIALPNAASSTGYAFNDTDDKTVNGCVIRSSANCMGHNWIAYGYIDISNYQYSPIYEYIVVASSPQTPLQVDINQIATDLNGKVSIADCLEVQCVVETYVNGTSWYRVYSDKWCEQGGQTAAGTSVTVNLLKTMADINYNVQLTCVNKAQGDQNWACSSKAVDSFVYSNSESFAVDWRVCGYIS